MSTAAQPPADDGPHKAHEAPPDAPHATPPFTEVQSGAEFTELRRSYRSFAFPLTIAFVLWYLLYVLLSNYAGGFMGTKVVGNVNVAFVFGLAQFVTTFLIAWWYSRHAAAKLDPKAEAIRARLENDAPRGEGDA
ncbi:DUF485 domain-containing protein [Streptomyces sp. CA-132043]|uniref:DUF485 domain-containing protein n=1 Tax=Streptomyces sp. CA-132043 TaxID=3240048 RepID=UPI003D8AEA96